MSQPYAANRIPTELVVEADSIRLELSCLGWGKLLRLTRRFAGQAVDSFSTLRTPVLPRRVIPSALGVVLKHPIGFQVSVETIVPHSNEVLLPIILSIRVLVERNIKKRWSLVGAGFLGWVILALPEKLTFVLLGRGKEAEVRKRGMDGFDTRELRILVACQAGLGPKKSENPGRNE